MIKVGFVLFGVWITAIGSAYAQSGAVDNYSPPVLSAAEIAQQEACLETMSGFPNDNATARYQFFKLTKMMAVDATPEFRAALAHFSDGQVSAETPLLEIIDGVANPVIRQAMPNQTVAHAGYLINFAIRCQNYVDGQLSSLIAYDLNLTEAGFNEVIAEDALFLRQILSEALYRIGAGDHPEFGRAINANADALTRSRDRIEFASFDTSVSEVEAQFMNDLDGRLAKVNDLINSEMDRDILSDSVSLADDMSKSTRKENERRVVRTLFGILNSY